MDRWPHQIFGVQAVKEARSADVRRICLTSPTGGGKSVILSDLIEDDIANGLKVSVYSNRKLLIEQLSKVLSKASIAHGVRAADYEQDFSKQVQISSVQTELSRSIKTKRWNLHPANSIYVDEAHINAADSVVNLQDKHLEVPGSTWVGITATPLDIGHMYDKLIVAGTKQSCRECGALVFAKHYGIDSPDMRKFKPNIKTGEYKEGDVVKAIMTKNVFGRVWDHWKLLNPEAKPTILFAPGVKESIWFAEEFRKKGVRFAHIDGENCWIDGEFYPTNIEVREQILSDVRKGNIVGVSNRFICREGIDLPELEHMILATVVGSLQSYLQMTGRLLRACKYTGKQFGVIQDHGGHFLRAGLGSVNADRDWDLSVTERMMTGVQEEAYRDKSEPEPICCAKCRFIRQGGNTCPECGFRSTKSSRIVVQQDGTLVEHTGDYYKPRRIKLTPNTEKLWEDMYYRAKRSGMTFSQCRGLFFVENHYYPPQNIPFMPIKSIDWYKKVTDVPRDSLTYREPVKEPMLF